MKFSHFGNIFLFFAILMGASLASAQIQESRGELFQKLADVGIDQVIELPYNRSMISKFGRQVRLHNIANMTHGQLPEPTNLREEFESSHESPMQREIKQALSYKVGKGRCDFMEAVKVSETLVCYKRAEATPMLGRSRTYMTIVSGCMTAMSQLSSCFVFAHNVDDVVTALSSSSDQ